MPLAQDVRDAVLDYCDRDLPPTQDVAAMFDFITDTALREKVESEFHAARYIYKLGEALGALNERLHPHVKFQIVQYASIYEAIIVNLLWTKYAGHPEVTAIEYHAALRKAVTLLQNLIVTNDVGENIYLCVERQERTPAISIKFDDTVNAAVKIGFVDPQIGDDIKSFYKLRNAIHLESAIQNAVTYEIDSSLLAYRRMLPFTRGIKGFLTTGKIPDDARPKAVTPAIPAS
jgi:hypothetical protein